MRFYGTFFQAGLRLAKSIACHCWKYLMKIWGSMHIIFKPALIYAPYMNFKCSTLNHLFLGGVVRFTYLASRSACFCFLNSSVCFCFSLSIGLNSNRRKSGSLGDLAKLGSIVIAWECCRNGNPKMLMIC
jgi:hypothetical protein